MIKRSALLCISLLVGLGLKAQDLRLVSYKDGQQELKGLVSTTNTQKMPGVLILPAWKGIDDEAKEAAKALTQEGYHVFIADIYGKGNIPTDNTTAAKIAGSYKQDFKAYQHRIKLALEAFYKQGVDPDRIAVIGYCFGGTGALEAARANMSVQGVVSIHGGLAKDTARANRPIHTKILVQHPAEDKSVSKADYDQLVEELREGKADWQIISYANSGHTFTNPAAADYNATMAKRAWKHLLVFLEEILKK